MSQILGNLFVYFFLKRMTEGSKIFLIYKSLITLSNGRCTKTLEEIILSYLPISEFVLLKFLKNFVKLKKMSLYGCYNLKHVDEVKDAIEPKNENLKNLIINV